MAAFALLERDGMEDGFASAGWDGRQAMLQADHLVTAVKSGGRAVGFVTADHEGALWEALDALGLGPGAAKPGQLLLCSAEAALDRLLASPSLAQGFTEVVGVLLDRPTATTGPLHVLDEVGSLARLRGKDALAQELEELWLESARRGDLSVVTMGAPYEGGDGRHLGAIGAANEPLADAVETAGLVLPPSASSPAGARAFARQVLAGWERPGPEEAVLVVSELATNAVVHAGSPFSVALARLPDGVRVSVRDLSASFEGGEPEVDGLHGLGIVSRLSRRWGVGHRGAGKTVWSELAVTGAD